MLRGDRQAYVQQSLSDRKCQNLHLLRLCALCGKNGDDRIAAGKDKIKWYSEDNHFKDMNRIDGMPTEFEWNIFPGFTTLGLLEKIQSLMRDPQCEPEHFKDKIIMSMHNNIKWFSENRYVKDLNRIDGEPMEDEWKNFPGITTLGLLEKTQSLMTDLQCEPKHFKDRIIFMSMHNVIK